MASFTAAFSNGACMLQPVGGKLYRSLSHCLVQTGHQVDQERAGRDTEHAELLMRWDLTAKDAVPVFRFTDAGPKIDAWDVAGDGLYYVTLDSSHCLARVIAANLKNGKENKVCEFPVRSVEYWQPAISAAPDDRSVIVAQTDRDDARLMAVQVGE